MPDPGRQRRQRVAQNMAIRGRGAGDEGLSPHPHYDSKDQSTIEPDPTMPMIRTTRRKSAVSSGSRRNSAVVACVRDGTVLFWGRCEDGQAGMDTGELPGADVEVGGAGKVRSVRVPTVVPDITAVRVAAGSDCTFAVAADGHVHAWGYSDGYRTGLGTDDTVDRPREIKRDANKASLADKVFETVETGGQFTVITGPSS
ncbi:hypothetical protein MAPG_06037 [Magnaporthiopsis poae ATCC 64411]|uniref:Regulator of chromosome condensation n=1 Tax=Magnaporthiopsis poae (strain ATCC 64411 / 73-15) TaxID=644358 RepID=A0A0C4E0Z5_MAGP6|nr:hypothetical protein MAPG_06037 [Magnaporthiopsis poae ATCC 64411]